MASQGVIQQTQGEYMSNIGDLIQHEVKERPPHVRFSREAVENKLASEREGRYIAVDVDYATLTPPGGGGNGVKWKIAMCRDYYKREIQGGRMAPQWIDDFNTMYARWQAGQEIPVNGAPVRGWMVISPAQQEMLIARGVSTLEDLAALNAEGIQRLGMGGVELKNKAQNALTAAKDVGPLVMKNAALERDLALMKANYETLEKRLNDALAARNDAGEPLYGKIEDSIDAEDILGDDVEDLTEQYTKKFGAPPHHRMKRETIERALKE
jgi:hypothetical protein